MDTVFDNEREWDRLFGCSFLEGWYAITVENETKDIDETLTIKDLITAIKIIRKFLSVYRESQSVINQLASYYKYSYSRPEDRFIDAFLKQQQQQLGIGQSQNPANEELTEEEKERLKKLREKMSSESK